MGNNNSSSASGGRPQQQQVKVQPQPHFHQQHRPSSDGNGPIQLDAGNSRRAEPDSSCVQLEPTTQSQSVLYPVLPILPMPWPYPPSKEVEAEVEETDEEDGEGEPLDLEAEADKLEAVKHVKVYKLEEVEDQKLTVIGDSGGFGKVLGGVLRGKRIAIKMFHAPPTRPDTPEHFAKLVKLGHRNVVTIVGLIEEDGLSGEIQSPKVILQYLAEGNLLQYLAKKDNPQDYAMLGKLALDIIHGSEYLHSNNVVHGSLAARNILIEKSISRHRTHFNAKVTDYGIMQHFEASGGNYIKNNNGKMVPVRWVPRELITDDDTATDFTTASDVWSFGIILWEMWAKGDTPYGLTNTNLQVLQLLKDGKCPLTASHTKLKGCPGHILAVMHTIFKVNPEERPTFKKLQDEFTTFKEKAQGKKAGGQKPAPESTQNQKEKVQVNKANLDGDGKNSDDEAQSEQGEEKKRKKKGKNTPRENQDKAQSPEKKEKKKEANSPKKEQPTAKSGKGGEKKQKGEEGGDQPQNQKTGESGDQQDKQKSGGGKGPDQSQKSGKGHPSGGPRPHNPAQRGGRHFQRGGYSQHHRPYPPRGPSPSGQQMFGQMMDSQGPPAPPPYSPSLLPNHSGFGGSPPGPMAYGFSPMPPAYFAPPPPPVDSRKPAANSLDLEIQRHQEHIRSLKTEKFRAQINEKQAELNELVQKLAEHGLSPSGGAGETSSIGGSAEPQLRSGQKHHHSGTRGKLHFGKARGGRGGKNK